MITIREKYKPTQEALEAIENATSLVLPDEENLREWYHNYARNHTHRLAFDLEYLDQECHSPSETSVLELGSTPPILTTAMVQKGYDVTGFDLDPERFENSVLNNQLKISKGSIGSEPLPFPNASFDVVIMNEVLEHLNTNLIDALNDIKRVMTPNGKLFISTPNLRSMVGIRNFLFRGKAYSCSGEIYEEYEKVSKYGHMGHVREYTPTELILFLEKMNFKVETLIYRGKYPKKYRAVEYLFPKLRPFFSVIAVNS
ncbi:MAG: class I SAM-dependent methyltransferase [Flavobacteriaceae bacterium]|nr:class I SAM-dependent methyltransferase [Flavobacteriaceae bacterium]